MNYQKIYDAIIHTARSRSHDLELFEKHHILPKSLGGSDDCSNIVKLSLREHFICHMLLFKLATDIPSKTKMIAALNLMTSKIVNDGGFNSKKYEFFRSMFYKNHPSKLDRESFTSSIKLGMDVSFENRGFTQYTCMQCNAHTKWSKNHIDTYVCDKCKLENKAIKLSQNPKCMCGCR